MRKHNTKTTATLAPTKTIQRLHYQLRAFSTFSKSKHHLPSHRRSSGDDIDAVILCIDHSGRRGTRTGKPLPLDRRSGRHVQLFRGVAERSLEVGVGALSIRHLRPKFCIVNLSANLARAGSSVRRGSAVVLKYSFVTQCRLGPLFGFAFPGRLGRWHKLGVVLDGPLDFNYSAPMGYQPHRKEKKEKADQVRSLHARRRY